MNAKMVRFSISLRGKWQFKTVKLFLKVNLGLIDKCLSDLPRLEPAINNVAFKFFFLIYSKAFFKFIQ
jgi:hypothetical protein